MDIHNLRCRHITLLEIADVERAVSGKRYPAGTVYIQVSACRRAGLEQFKMLGEERTIESKYAVIIPKVNVYPPYLKEALERCADAFMYRFVGTNINISVRDFKYFELDWHDSYETQKYIIAAIASFEQAAAQEEKAVEELRRFKQQMLKDMMM